MSSNKGFKNRRFCTDYRGELTPVVQGRVMTQAPAGHLHLSTGQMIVGGLIGVVLLVIFLAILLTPNIMFWTIMWHLIK